MNQGVSLKRVCTSVRSTTSAKGGSFFSWLAHTISSLPHCRPCGFFFPRDQYKEDYIPVCGSITTFFLSRKITPFLTIFWTTDSLICDSNQKKTHLPLLPCWVFIVEKFVFQVSHTNSVFKTTRW